MDIADTLIISLVVALIAFGVISYLSEGVDPAADTSPSRRAHVHPFRRNGRAYNRWQVRLDSGRLT
jgi:hypothetical protein